EFVDSRTRGLRYIARRALSNPVPYSCFIYVHLWLSCRTDESRSSRSLCAISNRFPTHRRRAHGTLQLAVCATSRRQIYPADRGYRQSPQYRRSGKSDLPWIALVGTRVGRRSARRRRLWALFSKRARRGLRTLSKETPRRRSYFRRPMRVTISLAARARRG